MHEPKLPDNAKPSASAEEHDSAELFRLLFDESRDAIIWADAATGVLIRCNRAAEILLGRTSAEIAGQPQTVLHPPEALDHSIETFRDHAGLKSWAPAEVVLLAKDGRRIPVEVSPSVATIAGRTVVQGNFRDITERKRVDDALRANDAHLRAILDSTAGGILVIGETGEVLLANRQFADMWHVPEEMMRSRQDAVLLAHVLDQLEDPAAFLREVERLYRTNEDHDDALRFKDGRVFDRRSRAVMLEGRRLGRLWSFYDVTSQRQADEERLQLEAQVRHAQKLESLGILAGGIAHDFNNILMAILGNADLALHALPAATSARPCIEEIVTAARNAADLVRQMLAYSGKGRLEVRTVDLSLAANDIAHLLHASISKKAALRMQLAQNLPTVQVDVAQLHQILINLIVNASEALDRERGGLITIRTGEESYSQTRLARSRLPDKAVPGHFVFVEITDTGCGMTSEVIEKLFDPFFTTKFQGRGLGMSAVLGIVRGHRGAIFIDSEPGLGSTIRVLFPALDAPVPKARDTRARQDPPPWKDVGSVTPAPG